MYGTGFSRCWDNDRCTFYLRMCALRLSLLLFILPEVFVRVLRPTYHIQMTVNKKTCCHRIYTVVPVLASPRNPSSPEQCLSGTLLVVLS